VTAAEAGRQRQVRDILRRNPGMPKPDVAKRAGVSVRTVERVIG
jgi:Bacterial regulatory proteins, lacI family